MALGRYTKQPREKKRYSIDYSAWLADGETIVGVPVFEVDLDTDEGGPGTLVVDLVSIIHEGASIQYFVSSGADGEQYKVTVLATTSDAQIKEDEIIYVIEEE